MLARFLGQRARYRRRTDHDSLSKAPADHSRANDRAAIQAGRPSINEEWITFATDGYHGLFETIKTPMRDHEGNPIGTWHCPEDITG